MNVTIYKEQDKFPTSRKKEQLRGRSKIRLPTPLPPAITNCLVLAADAIEDENGLQQRRPCRIGA